MEHGNGRRPVLVTGAQGFIGRRLIRRLIDQVETVVAFDTAPLPATEQDGHDRRLNRLARGYSLGRRTMY